MRVGGWVENRRIVHALRGFECAFKQSRAFLVEEAWIRNEPDGLCRLGNPERQGDVPDFESLRQGSGTDD